MKQELTMMFENIKIKEDDFGKKENTIDSLIKLFGLIKIDSKTIISTTACYADDFDGDFSGYHTLVKLKDNNDDNKYYLLKIIVPTDTTDMVMDDSQPQFLELNLEFKIIYEEKVESDENIIKLALLNEYIEKYTIICKYLKTCVFLKY